MRLLLRLQCPMRVIIMVSSWYHSHTQATLRSEMVECIFVPVIHCPSWWYDYSSPPPNDTRLGWKKVSGSGVCPSKEKLSEHFWGFCYCYFPSTVRTVCPRQQLILQLELQAGPRPQPTRSWNMKKKYTSFLCKALKLGDYHANLAQPDRHTRIVIKWEDTSLHTLES